VSLDVTKVRAHKTKHQDGGADELSVAALSGLLANDQHVLDAEVTAVAIPLAQKAAASGVASLNASSLVVQKPADRLSKANFEITLDKLLKGAGAGADPTEIDVPAVNFFDKFRDFIPWVSLDGFNIGGDTGYEILIKGSCITVEAGGTQNYDALLYSKYPWSQLVATGKVLTVEFVIQRLGLTASQNIWLRFAEDYADPPSETSIHFGWKIVDKDIYASNANGATQTITDTLVDLATGYQRTRLKAVLTPGTDCKFYVDDVLKVTHTTNLPVAGSNAYLHVHVRTLEAVVKYIYLERVLIEREL